MIKIKGIAEMDDIWSRIKHEIAAISESEEILAKYLHTSVLYHHSLEASLSYLLAGKLETPYVNALPLREVIHEAFLSSPTISSDIRRDLRAVLERDPVARSFVQPFLYYKGFHALAAYRVANWLWIAGRTSLAYYLQNRISEVFGVDIHPAAAIGNGIFIDHGTCVVIGETAVVGNNVSMLHDVTLGGTGKESGDRHPKVGNGVLVGAGAKILGNVKIGNGSKIAAGSVVLTHIPPHSTVAGIPAKIVGRTQSEESSLCGYV